MRLLCILLGIGFVIWHLDAPSPLASVGFFIAAPVVGAHLANRFKLPAIPGMMCMGILVAPLPFTTAENHQAMQPFADIALSWTGLLLGSLLSRPALQNRRLVTGAVYLSGIPCLTTFAALFPFNLSLPLHLQLAIISGLTAPIFFAHQDQQK